MTRRLWAVAYDVADDGRRYRLEKLLRSHAVRVQFSVFEGYMTLAELHALFDSACAAIDSDADSLRCYPVCAWCEDRLVCEGRGRRTDQADYWIV